MEAEVLPAHTTNQQAGLIALIHVFQLTQGQSLNISTSIMKEFGLLTTKGGSITNTTKFMTML